MFTRKHRIYVAAITCALSVFVGSAAEAGGKPGASSGAGVFAATGAALLNGILMPAGSVLAGRKPGVASGSGAIAATGAARAPMPMVHDRVLAAGKMGGAGGMDIPITVELPDGLVLAAGKSGGAGGADTFAVETVELPDRLVLAGGAAGGIVGSWK